MAATMALEPEPLLDLQRLFAGIRWRRRMWLGLGLVGLILGCALAVLSPPAPTAITRILVTRENDVPGQSEGLMKTDVALFQTSAIANDAMKRVGATDRLDRFLASFTVTALTDNILEVDVHGSSNADAVARAQALADTFIADHLRRTRDAAAAVAKSLTDRQAEAEVDLKKVNDQIVAASPRANDPGVAAQLTGFYDTRSQLAAQIQDLGQRAESSNDGTPKVIAGTQIVDAPRAVAVPMLTRAAPAGIGLLLGIGLGLAIAAIGSVAGDRPVLRRDIAAHLGASVVAQLPAPRPSRFGLRRQSRGRAELERVAGTLVRVVREARSGLAVLDLGSPATTAALATDIARVLSADHPVTVIDSLPDREVTGLVTGSELDVRVIDGADPDLVSGRGDEPEADHTAARKYRIGVGSVQPGTAWTDLPDLGSEAIVVVRAGATSTLWLHTVARQLADVEVLVLGVVLVHPDPRDRSDGTLWDGLQTALRGRATATKVIRVAEAPPDPAIQQIVLPRVVPADLAQIPTAAARNGSTPAEVDQAGRPTPAAADTVAVRTNGHALPRTRRSDPFHDRGHGSAPTPAAPTNGRAPRPDNGVPPACAPAPPPRPRVGKATRPSPVPRPSPSQADRTQVVRPSPMPRPAPTAAAPGRPAGNGRPGPAPSVDGHPTDKLPSVVRPTSDESQEVS